MPEGNCWLSCYIKGADSDENILVMITQVREIRRLNDKQRRWSRQRRSNQCQTGVPRPYFCKRSTEQRNTHTDRQGAGEGRVISTSSPVPPPPFPYLCIHPSCPRLPHPHAPPTSLLSNPTPCPTVAVPIPSPHLLVSTQTVDYNTYLIQIYLNSYNVN